ncbi:hypothetical protein LSH36_95g08030 [Paralvinella palmiformis]|uniref:Glycosyltransferase family 92 protein n=1 Tax=Paralvinella palmiformis TaxID=53620 RepID=A0AAD9K1E8_9ANNE|nr:hypothetical protein LSH36_95g08030 [Paralvinella palmiformis]
MTEDEAFSASVNDTVAAMFVTSHNIMKLHYNIAPRSPEISITRQNVAKKYSSSEELCYNVPTTVMATFTVCLWQPLFLLRYDPEWFVEWMEYNILFGADLIQIYSYDIPKTLYTYIGYYQRLGVLYLLPWTLPKIADNTKYNRRLQFAMILECHLRYQYKSK